MIELGDIKLFPVSAGSFRLDGGGMFGAVPRTMWEKAATPDEKNRVTLGLCCLLVDNGTDVVLIDTGVGDKGDERFCSIYAVDNRPSLAQSLRSAGYTEDDVTVVINTHLHFDHAGGNTILAPDGRIIPAFPNARYVVQKGELESALNPTERTRASYRAENFVPVMDAGLFDLVEGGAEVTPGVSVFRTGGHNRDIQLVRIESGGRTAVFASDIIPTAAHLDYPWIAAYDQYPADVLEVKKGLIERAAAGRWLLFFPHDPGLAYAYVRMEDGRPAAEAP